jgi:hypothetical protein
MAFEKGISGNPNGRAKGSFNNDTILLRSVLEGKKEKILNVAIKLALGDAKNDPDTFILGKLLDKVLPTMTKNENTNHDGDFLDELKAQIILKRQEISKN